MAQTCHFAPGNRYSLLPGAQTCHFAPGNRYSLLPGANTGRSAPGSEKKRIPGAENSLFAPGKLPKSNGEGDWETSGWHWDHLKQPKRFPKAHFDRVGNNRMVPEVRGEPFLFPKSPFWPGGIQPNNAGGQRRAFPVSQKPILAGWETTG